MPLSNEFLLFADEICYRSPYPGLFNRSNQEARRFYL